MDDKIKQLLARQDWTGLLRWADGALSGGKTPPLAWKIKGFSHAALGENLKAIESLQKADELVTDLDVLTNLGVLLHNAKLFDEAEIYYKRAAQLCPDQPRMHANLAELYADTKNFGAAAHAYCLALELAPDDTTLLYNLAVCYQKGVKPDAAIAAIDRALQQVDSHKFRVKRGEIYIDLGKRDLAQKDFEQVLAAEPTNIGALLGLAELRLNQRSYSAALDLIQKLETVQPSNYLAHALKADTLKGLGRYADALECYESLLNIEPNNLILRNNLANLLIEIGESSRAEEMLQDIIKSDPRFFEAYSNLIYCIHLRSERLSESELETILGYEKSLLSQSPKVHLKYPEKKLGIKNILRIGFVTGDLNGHPVGYFSEAMLAELKRRGYLLYGFSSHAQEDQQTEKIKKYLDAWVPIFGMDDNDAYRLIRNHDINILFDLSGHTAYNRLGLFSLRPANIQISYLGYFGTTGLKSIDYILASEKVIYKQEFAAYTEAPLLLKCSHLVYRPPVLAKVQTKAPYEKNGYITFGVFNRLSKFNQQVLEVWAQVLVQNRQGKILFVGKGFDDEQFVSHFRNKLLSLGVNHTQLRFRGHVSLNEYFELFNSVDVSLDTFPFPGGTTTLDSLMMGVPVITKRGQSLIGRQGEMILETLDLTDWIASDNQDYVRIAGDLENQLGYLKRLRQVLRERVLKSELYDSTRFGAELDFHLRTIYEASLPHRKGELG